ncbi:MAG TPA: helix-turn-helix transcriptional regulator [Planctomycetota bacterium]|nr:helix-turn-helix transcriptional regulator [Planctomycetota bacterium]
MIQRKFSPQRARLARQNAVLKQGEVAEQLHRTRPAISEIECGKFTPSEALVEAMALLYGVPVAELYDTEHLSPPEAGLSPEEAHAIEVLRRLPPILRGRALGYIEGLQVPDRDKDLAELQVRLRQSLIPWAKERRKDPAMQGPLSREQQRKFCEGLFDRIDAAFADHLATPGMRGVLRIFRTAMVEDQSPEEFERKISRLFDVVREDQQDQAG